MSFLIPFANILLQLAISTREAIADPRNSSVAPKKSFTNKDYSILTAISYSFDSTFLSQNSNQSITSLALNEIRLRHDKEAEAYLDTIIQTQLKRDIPDTVLFSEYNNLFLHCLRSNLNRVFPKAPQRLERPSLGHPHRQSPQFWFWTEAGSYWLPKALPPQSRGLFDSMLSLIQVIDGVLTQRELHRRKDEAERMSGHATSWACPRLRQ